MFILAVKKLYITEILQKRLQKFILIKQLQVPIVSIVSKNTKVTKQTQNICITFVQWWTNVFDVGPPLYKCYTHVLRLRGIRLT